MFEKLKGALEANLVLVFPAPDMPMLLDTDASGIGLGAVLSQLDVAGCEQVVGYTSLSLSQPGKNYCVTW